MKQKLLDQDSILLKDRAVMYVKVFMPDSNGQQVLEKD